MIVPKKEKVKNQHTYATYVSSKKLSKNDLSKITDANFRWSRKLYKIIEIDKENFMKKFILGLFLILGAISFAAPKYVNTDKITQLGYKVDNDIPEIFLFQKMEPDGTGISITLFEIPNKSSKYISDMEKKIHLVRLNL